jgi:RNA polymerase sigma-70 factor (ECF subfamily)
MTSTHAAASSLHPAAFLTTHWSLVARAAATSGTEAETALEQLCRAYWQPLYSYVRRQGRTPEEAQDLTQAFFARLLEKRYLAMADPNRGRFRTFLLTALQRFLINDWQKCCAGKRGGSDVVRSWEEEEIRYVADRSDDTPEKLFEKRWAVALLEGVLTELEAETAAAGHAAQFREMKVLLWGEGDGAPQAEVARRLGLSSGALKVALHRLRHRYRQLLRAEVARTVSSQAEVDEELRHLIAVLSG